jgi:hypothetical protein
MIRPLVGVSGGGSRAPACVRESFRYAGVAAGLLDWACAHFDPTVDLS